MKHVQWKATNRIFCFNHFEFGAVVAGEWPSRLRRCDRIGRFSVQALPGAQLCLTTQPHHEALTDLGNCIMQ